MCERCGYRSILIVARGGIVSIALFSALFLLCLAQDTLSEADGVPEYSILWSSDGPRTITQTNDFECHGQGFKAVIEKNASDETEMVLLEIDGRAIAGDLLADVREFMDRFQRIDTVNFSCGGLYEGPNPHSKYGRDFRGQISIGFTGRSAEEPDDAASVCYDRGGIYLEEAVGNIILSSERVIRVDEPELGICVFGVTSVDIPRPNAAEKDL